LNDPFSELLKQNKDREFFEDHMSETGQYLDLNGVNSVSPRDTRCSGEVVLVRILIY